MSDQITAEQNFHSWLTKKSDSNVADKFAPIDVDSQDFAEWGIEVSELKELGKKLRKLTPKFSMRTVERGDDLEPHTIRFIRVRLFGPL
jgi:hypothetical protein